MGFCSFHRGNLKVDEWVTLCPVCHLGKHSVLPAVFKRDNFTCQECGKKPDDAGFWSRQLILHRLQGFCLGDLEMRGDPTHFITLCKPCHKLKHPDLIAEAF
jgi:5-methylcytosine-specific restriction endonuclease McrA